MISRFAYHEQLQAQWELMLAQSWHPSQWWVERSDKDEPHTGDVKMWVYRQHASSGRWIVGYYDPEGKWLQDSDHDEREDAVERVRYLNGGNL